MRIEADPLTEGLIFCPLLYQYLFSSLTSKKQFVYYFFIRSTNSVNFLPTTFCLIKKWTKNQALCKNLLKAPFTAGKTGAALQTITATVFLFSCARCFLNVTFYNGHYNSAVLLMLEYNVTRRLNGYLYQEKSAINCLMDHCLEQIR